VKTIWFCLCVVLAIAPATASAGKATYDLVKYTPPAPWKKVAWIKDIKKDKNNVSYTMTDKSSGTYCQIFIIRSTTSKGDVDADFESEWKAMIVGSYKDTSPPVITDTAEDDGWKVKAGVTTFEFNNETSIAMLTTISGYDRAVSIVAVTSSQDYLPAVQALLGSIEMKKPPRSASSTPAKAAGKTAKPVALQGYMEYSPYTKSYTWKLRYPQPSK
jgi:hypothetical protein